MLKNKIYFVDRINSSKANKFTEAYHYSGTGFKKAQYNLGIFRNEDKLLVGVLQWGTSYAMDIRLDRYVKEPLARENYLELNRFCMADSEGKNSESQAISLGIKWIKENLPDIKLLVSYAGRKEGNYGYIYQATNWEYLGYFISPGFWFADGEERHQISLWYRHIQHDPKTPFLTDLLTMYKDLRQTWTKQFIYIQRLDKHLTPATEPLPYPKPDNEYPIMVKEKIHKQDDEVFNNYSIQKKEPPIYYWEKEKYFFSIKTLRLRGELPPTDRSKKQYAIYDVYGHLQKTSKTIRALEDETLKHSQLAEAAKTGKSYKNIFIKAYELNEEIPEEIEVPIIAIIDEIPFPRIQDIADYLNVSKQAVSKAKIDNKNKIKNTAVIWTCANQVNPSGEVQ